MLLAHKTMARLESMHTPRCVANGWLEVGPYVNTHSHSSVGRSQTTSGNTRMLLLGSHLQGSSSR